MLSYALKHVSRIEGSPSIITRTQAVQALRKLDFGDFGHLLIGMPDKRFPRMSSLLPSMASAEVQANWTGNHGTALLGQSVAVVRSMVSTWAHLRGQGLSGCHVLDYGCGYGRLARLMYYFTDPENVFGCDPWDKSIALCREAGLGPNFRQSDYYPADLPFDERFDLIYAFSVFTHTSPKATRYGLRALRRYVAEDGLLMVTIRPAEYWDYPQPDLPPAAELREKHTRDGYCFVPHNLEPISGDIPYGDASYSLDWLDENATGWTRVSLDTAPEDALQIYVYLRPA
jgi:SAM-dependent methyltransferase